MPKCFWGPLSEISRRCCFRRVDLSSIPWWLVLSLFKFTSFSPCNSGIWGIKISNQFGIKNISPPKLPFKIKFTHINMFTWSAPWLFLFLVYSLLLSMAVNCLLLPLHCPSTVEGCCRHIPAGHGSPWHHLQKETSTRSSTLTTWKRLWFLMLLSNIHNLRIVTLSFMCIYKSNIFSHFWSYE